jgi:SAM-dependent methyltransferase
MKDYRTSHTSRGYGQIYQRTYQTGYYAAQWERIEKPLLRKIFDELYDEGNRSYLDFACGTGRIVKVGEEFFDEVDGVDISMDMAQHAREICTRAKIIAPRDITEEPLEKKYDVVSAFRFFLNAQPDLRREVLTAISNMQKPNGALVCNIHVNSRSILGLTYRFRNWLRSEEIAATLGIEELSTLLNDMGYNVERTYRYSYWPRIGNRAPWLQEKALLFFERIQGIVPIVPRSMAQSIMLVCRKR